MSFLVSILPTLLVLGLLILIHEWGHFIACRLTGVNVEKFSIGFGPEVLHWQTKRTRFSLSLLPLGGYVKPAGESIGEVEGEEPKPGDYLAAPLGSRIFIVTAGVIMNYVLAFVLFVFIFCVGRPVPGTTIGGFVDDYPAKESGLAVGDRIVNINGIEVTTWEELLGKLSDSPSAYVNLEVLRTSEGNRVRRMNFNLEAKVEEGVDLFGKKSEVKRLGIQSHPEAQEFEQYSFLPAVKRAWETGFTMTVMTHKAIFYLITGKMSPKTLAGPLGIVSITGSAAKLGLTYVLQLMATLSISLAVLNLLPIPALDGGHLLFLLIEGIRGKEVSLKVQERATTVGFALLMALMVFVLYNDFINLNFLEKIKGLFS